MSFCIFPWFLFVRVCYISKETSAFNLWVIIWFKESRTIFLFFFPRTCSSLSYKVYSEADERKEIKPLIILHGLFGSKTNWHSFAKKISATGRKVGLPLLFKKIISFNYLLWKFWSHTDESFFIYICWIALNGLRKVFIIFRLLLKFSGWLIINRELFCKGANNFICEHSLDFPQSVIFIWTKKLFFII